MEFVIGFLGALVALALIGAGAVLGWTLHNRFGVAEQKVTAEALTEKQKQHLKEEEEAWAALHNYSPEIAYGMPIKSTTKE
jgi:hypothetical protein